jgi:hypothetical protein
LIAVLSAVMSECFEKEVCGVFDLKESTTIGGDGRGEVCAELLRRRERHLERIEERFGAEALFPRAFFQGLRFLLPPGSRFRAKGPTQQRPSE